MKHQQQQQRQQQQRQQRREEQQEQENPRPCYHDESNPSDLFLQQPPPPSQPSSQQPNQGLPRTRGPPNPRSVDDILQEALEIVGRVGRGGRQRPSSNKPTNHDDAQQEEQEQGQ